MSLLPGNKGTRVTGQNKGKGRALVHSIKITGTELAKPNQLLVS